MKFDAVGTAWAIETARPLPAPVQRSIYRRIELFDKIYSRFRDDSLVGMLEKRAGTYTFPQDSIELTDWYQLLYRATNGALSPLVGGTLSSLGYDKEYSFTPKDVKPTELWEHTMAWHGATVTITKPVSLDFGAAGKGYLVDVIGRILESNKIVEYVIDASGDMRHRGGGTQVIGLEHPDDPTRVIGTMSLHNKSLCASATNRRKWGEGLHHVINARTGQPVDTVKATWVVAENTIIADGLATALFFCDPSQLKELGEFQYVRLFSNGSVEHSKDLMGELFI